MTVAELIAELQRYPAHYQVKVWDGGFLNKASTAYRETTEDIVEVDAVVIE